MSKTYAQLAREIAALQASAQRQLAIESKSAVAKINDMIAEYGLAASDLTFASRAAAAAVPISGSKAVKRSADAGTRSRFSDGQGNVWGGRGPRPRWLRSAIAAGRTIESFLTEAAPVRASAPASPAPRVGSAARKKIAAKKVAARRAPAAAKAPAAPTANMAADAAAKTVAKPSAARKSKKGASIQKTADRPAVKTASSAKPASKKASAKKVAGVKRAGSSKPAKKAAPNKVVATRKTASKAKSSAAKQPAGSASQAAIPATS